MDYEAEVCNYRSTLCFAWDNDYYYCKGEAGLLAVGEGTQFSSSLLVEVGLGCEGCELAAL